MQLQEKTGTTPLGRAWLQAWISSSTGEAILYATGQNTGS